MQRFNLKLGRLKFSAELKYRITVIDDESGKGKTCEFKNFFIDSRKAFKLSKYSDYVIWK